MNYPETYLHIRHNQSGETWIQEIKPNWLLDIQTRIRHFLKTEFGGELKLDGIQAHLDGDYTATIYTDGREPDCGICWCYAGFWVKTTY